MLGLGLEPKNHTSEIYLLFCYDRELALGLRWYYDGMPLIIRPYITPTGIIAIRYNIIPSGNIALRS